MNSGLRPIERDGGEGRIDAHLLDALHTAGSTWVSGSVLAAELGVSRTSVWKHIARLKQMGYGIETVPFRGYRLVDVPDRLLAAEIRRQLRCWRLGTLIRSYPVVESTNDVALAFGRDGAPEGTVVVADRQTAGRGRLGRTWESAPGVGLWFSLILRPNIAPRNAAWLTLFAAVSVVRLLRENTDIQALIKWPNDVLIDGKKVCGILTELVAEQDRIEYAVVGIGLNVNQTRRDFGPVVRDTATSVRKVAGRTFNRTTLLCRLIELLEEDYYLMLEQGFEVIRRMWTDQSATMGQNVQCEWDGTVVVGKAMGLSDEGALLVRQTDGTVVPVVRGDVTVL